MVSDNEPIVPEIPVASEVAISRVFACPTVDKPLSPPQDQTQVWEYSLLVLSLMLYLLTIIAISGYL